MQKEVLVAGIIACVFFNAHAETVLMKTDSGYTTTGELLDEVRDEGITTNVQEIADLLVTARTDNPDHKLNANADSLGINNMTTNADEPARFEVDEKMILSFSKNVVITNLDFRFFDSGEAFTVAVSGQAPVVIDYEELDHKSSDYIATNIVVAADTDVEFFTTGSGVIGLESIGLELAEGGGGLSLFMTASNGTMYVYADFNGAVETNYVLQSCSNLASNDWSTVSGFSADTNWVVEATNGSSFYRAIPQ